MRLARAAWLGCCAWALAIAPQSAVGVTGPPLQFMLQPQVRWVSSTEAVVPFELTNIGDHAVYVAQFPGARLMATCLTASGAIGGAPGGAWSRDGDLPRKYFLRLAPGEALMGEARVRVSSDCRSNLEVVGVYESEDHNSFNLEVPGSRFPAAPLPVDLAARPPLVLAGAFRCAISVTPSEAKAGTAVQFSYWFAGDADAIVPATLRAAETTYGASLRLRAGGRSYRFLRTPMFHVLGDLTSVALPRDRAAFTFEFPDQPGNARLVTVHPAQPFAEGLDHLPPGDYEVWAELRLEGPVPGEDTIRFRSPSSTAPPFPRCASARFTVSAR